jgi:hypothetical protein
MAAVCARRLGGFAILKARRWGLLLAAFLLIGNYIFICRRAAHHAGQRAADHPAGAALMALGGTVFSESYSAGQYCLAIIATGLGLPSAISRVIRCSVRTGTRWVPAWW